MKHHSHSSVDSFCLAIVRRTISKFIIGENYVRAKDLAIKSGQEEFYLWVIKFLRR